MGTSVDIEDFLVLESSGEDSSSSQTSVLSHRGRSFLVTGQALSEMSSTLSPTPPTQRRQSLGHYTGAACEESDVQDSSFHVSSRSLPALRKARTLNLESVNGSGEGEALAQHRKTRLTVRGRSFCKGIHCAMPSPIHEEELS